MSRKKSAPSRRQMLKQASAFTAGAAALNVAGCAAEPEDRRSAASDTAKGRSSGLTQDSNDDRRFVIVLTLSGGASILDSFMALNGSEVDAAGGNSATLNCFNDTQMVRVDGTDMRAIAIDHSIGPLGGYPISTDQSGFLRKHMNDMMVVTTEGTSVNHGVAQKRSVTGNDAWHGRTIQELVAEQYGKGLPIPNFNMGAGGFALPGIDPKLAEYAQGVNVTDPRFFPLGLDSSAGLQNVPRRNLLDLARKTRSLQLEAQSRFHQTFRGAPAVQRWLAQRGDGRRSYEQLDLVNKLYFLEQNAPGLKANADSQRLRELFPNYNKDSLDAQAIMAYQAITKGVSAAVTFGPTPATVSEGIDLFYNPPIAYDFSHTDHRGTQAMMWQRVLSVADRLIDLLKAKEYSAGESYWDRTTLYFATDFGRDKFRPANAEAYTTGHNLNNAVLVMSPQAKGNTILGGVDAATGNTYGFDLQSGAPEVGRKTSEKELFAGILGVAGVDTSGSGLPDVPAMRRNG